MESYLGVIEALGFMFVPRNYGACAGALIAISQNQSLYSLLSNHFGGDGRTTFGLPEMRGRIPMGQGTGPGLPTRVVGQKVGVEEVSLSSTNLPAHTHAHTYAGSGGGGSQASFLVAATGGKKPVADDGDYIAAPASALGTITNNLYISPTDMAGVTTVAIGGVAGGGGSFVSEDLAILNTGSGEPFSVVQPSQAVNYCICIQGLYPTRS